jgi:hypothetical protein
LVVVLSIAVALANACVSKPKCKEMLKDTELRQKAKDLYLQAYAQKDSNPEDGIPKVREVIAMTPSDDETHQKAQNWLDKIQR